MDTSKRETVLILEDEAIIAMDLEVTLSEAGFDVVQLIANCEDAMSWLQDNEPDLVVLDIHLGDGPCVEVAELLVARATPFVVFSASTPDEGANDEVFQRGRWVTKLTNLNEVIEALSSFDLRAA